MIISYTHKNVWSDIWWPGWLVKCTTLAIGENFNFAFSTLFIKSFKELQWQTSPNWKRFPKRRFFFECAYSQNLSNVSNLIVFIYMSFIIWSQNSGPVKRKGFGVCPLNLIKTYFISGISSMRTNTSLSNIWIVPQPKYRV